MLAIDSVATVDIIFAIEGELGTDVDDDDLRVELSASARSLVDCVEARLTEPTPPTGTGMSLASTSLPISATPP